MLAIAATFGVDAVARATPLYWDVNGATANTGTTAGGVWDGVVTNWNSDPTGGAGSALIAVTTNTDDLFFSSGTGHTGSSTITFSGTQAANKVTFEEGTITVSTGGTLNLGAGGFAVTNATAVTHVFNSAVSIAAAQTWVVGGTNQLTIGGAVDLSNELTINGTGTVRLAAASTGTAGLVMSGGTLIMNANGATGTGAFTINGGSLNGSGGQTQTNSVYNVNGDFTWLGTGTVTWNTGAVTLNGNRQITVTASSMTIGGGITGANTNLTKAGAGTLAVASNITTGTGSVVMNAGTLTLSGANTFSGGVNLAAGTLNVNSATALGTGKLTITGGTLSNGTAGSITNTNNNTQDWNGDFIYNSAQNLLMGTGAVSMNANRAISINGAGTLSVAGIISGTGFALTKGGTGAGGLSLAGANTFTGGVTLSTGTLNINNASALGTGTFSIAAGTTINNTSTAAITNSQNNAQTWNGSFTFTGGAATNNYNIGTGAVTLTVAPTVTVGANTTFTVGGVVSGTGLNALSIAKSGAGTVALTNTTAINLLSGQTITNNAGTLTISAPINNGAELLTVNSVGTTTLSGIIGNGSGGITKTGAGTLALSGVNTYTGVTTLSAGALALNSTQAIGTGKLIIAGGNLNNTSGGQLTNAGNNAMDWNADFSFTGANSLIMGTGAVAMNASRTVTVTGAGTLSVGGTISGTGFSLTKAGTGAGGLSLAGANTFDGGVISSAGKLNVNNAQGLGTGLLSIGAGTTIDNTSGAAVTVSTNNAQTWNGSFTFTGGNSLNLGTGAVTMTAAPTITASANALTVGGVISGLTFGIVKAGAGTLALNGANTFDGVVTVNAGTLATSNLADGGLASGLGTSGAAAGNLLLGNGSTLQYTGAGGSSNRAFTVNGTAANDAATIDASGTAALNLTSTGAIAWGTADQARKITLAGTNTGDNILAASIADNGLGATSLTKSGAGRWVLPNANTFTGPTTVSAGQLNLANINAVANSAVTVSGGTLGLRSNTSATFNAASLTLASVTINVDNNGSGTNQTLTLGPASIGANTLTVTGANGYGLSLGSLTQSAAGTTTIANSAPVTLSGFTSASTTTSTLAFTGTGVSTVTGAIVQTAGNTLSLTRGTAAGTTILQSTARRSAVRRRSRTVRCKPRSRRTRLGSTTGISIGGSGTLALRGDANATYGNGTTAYPVIATATGATINVDQVSAAAVGTTLTLGTVALSNGATRTLNVTGANGVSLAVGDMTASGAFNSTINNTIAGPGIFSINGFIEADASARTVTFSGSGTTSVGAITQNAANVLTVTQSGTGTLILNSAASTYTGLTTVSAGRILYGANNVLQSKDVTVSGGILDLGLNHTDTAGIVTLTGGSIVGTGTSALSTNQPNFLLQSGSVSASLAGAAGISKTTTGTVLLTGTNSYAGNTVVTAGVLSFGSTASIGGTGQSVSMAAAGTISLLGAADLTPIFSRVLVTTPGAIGLDVNSAAAIDFNAPGFTAASLGGVGTVRYSGTFTPQGTTYRLGGQGGTLVFEGALSGANNVAVSGFVTAPGAKTYSGITTLNSGILSIDTIANGGVNSGLGSSSNDAANLVFANGYFQYVGATATSDRNFTINAGTTGSIGVTNTLTMTGAAAATTGNLNKNGSGILILSGANLHTGLTQSNGGTLVLDYSAGNDPIAASGLRADNGNVVIRGQTTGVTTDTIPSLALSLSFGAHFRAHPGFKRRKWSEFDGIVAHLRRGDRGQQPDRSFEQRG
ncbi:MAG: autotransporter-associated beta strand repeat-containing protein [Pirellulales bacterium]